MTKERITADEFREILQREIDADRDCVGISRVQMMAMEGDNGGVWTPAFYGLLPGDKAGAQAARRIMMRLESEYEIFPGPGH